ncbi:hypothetical protein ILYODFUR_032510 [Ilyodon furcidens]|uniref:Uncharacterized protein n=1 Tax=Ilyodon furcidens TaxID=33524 RepID=A0ABV0SR26_9TELE
MSPLPNRNIVGVFLFKDFVSFPELFVKFNQASHVGVGLSPCCWCRAAGRRQSQPPAVGINSAKITTSVKELYSVPEIFYQHGELSNCGAKRGVGGLRRLLRF